MQAGKLRHRVFVEQPVVSRDPASGAELISFAPVGPPVWASIEPMLRGREIESGGQILTVLDTTIVLRWSPLFDAMTAKWRIREAWGPNPTIYNIGAPPVQTNLGKREIRVLCRSGSDEG